MLVATALFWFAGTFLVDLFLDLDLPENQAVLPLAVSFLAIAAVFQIADGSQVILAGALRGLKDTRAPLLFALVGYWGVALPGGLAAGVRAGLRGARCLERHGSRAWAWWPCCNSGDSVSRFACCRPRPGDGQKAGRSAARRTGPGGEPGQGPGPHFWPARSSPARNASTSPAQQVKEAQPLEVKGPDHPWVSRGGLKLEKGLGSLPRRPHK